MDNPDPLSELADIHLPDPIGLWPLAPGWWILIILGLIAAFFLGRRFIAQWKVNRGKMYALRELDKSLQEFRTAKAAAPEADVDQLKLNFVSEINAVLRRVALKKFPRQNPASLSGESWITFLRRNGDASLLNDEQAQTLSQGRFAKQWSVDEDALYQMAHKWISSLYLTRIGSGTEPDRTSPSTSVSEHA